MFFLLLTSTVWVHSQPCHFPFIICQTSTDYLYYLALKLYTKLPIIRFKSENTHLEDLKPWGSPTSESNRVEGLEGPQCTNQKTWQMYSWECYLELIVLEQCHEKDFVAVTWSNIHGSQLEYENPWGTKTLGSSPGMTTENRRLPIWPWRGPQVLEGSSF